MSATRAALRALRDGRVLGIFPEGRWSLDGNLLPFQPGVAMLALKGQAPIFPAYLEGTMSGRDMVGSVLRPCMATAAFGPQVLIDQEDTNRDGLERAARAIRDAVDRLKARVSGGV
jgi:1-acyl-sn-glycerol-3-phosphate acyltransferase